MKNNMVTEGVMEGNTMTKQCTINSFQTRLIKTAKDEVGRADSIKKAAAGLGDTTDKIKW